MSLNDLIYRRDALPDAVMTEGPGGAKVFEQFVNQIKSAPAVQKVDMSTVQRALGILEGVSYGVSDEAADGIMTAVEMIEGALGDG